MPGPGVLPGAQGSGAVPTVGQQWIAVGMRGIQDPFTIIPAANFVDEDANITYFESNGQIDRDANLNAAFHDTRTWTGTTGQGLKFTINSSTVRIGLDPAATYPTVNTVDYMLSFDQGLIKENGVTVGPPLPTVGGDVWEIIEVGGTMLYKRNGATFHTSVLSIATGLRIVGQIRTGGVDENKLNGLSAKPYP